MTDLQEALGLHQLQQLDGWIGRRTELWESYDELPAGLPLSLPAPAESGTRHARHLYQVLLDPSAPPRREGCANGESDRACSTGACTCIPTAAIAYELVPEQFPFATGVSHRPLSRR